MMKSQILCSLLLFGLAASDLEASTDQLFPEQISVAEQEFQKLGEYRYVYRFFFNLYDAALFLPKNKTGEDVLQATTSFHLQFRYLREIDKNIILESADQMLEKNLSPAERKQIAERVDRINLAYTTVRDGDMSSLTYQPGIGTTLKINGDPKLTIEGEDFARLYFRIWLGPKAISTSLKDNLLGNI